MLSMQPLDVLKTHAKEIFAAGIAAADPFQAVSRVLRLEKDVLCAGEATLPLVAGAKVHLLAIGKAAGPMAAAAEEILGDYLGEGLAVSKYDHVWPLRKVRLLQAGHPLPDDNGLAATRAVRDLVTKAAATDLVVCLLSGGASALLPAPAAGISLAEKLSTTELLLGCGAGIQEINCVRKHLSTLKGGGLARLVAPRKLLTLVLSDVVGDPLDVIASGPTVADPTSFAEAMAVVGRYQLLQRLPAAVRRHLEQGCVGRIPETPKPGDACFAGQRVQLVGSNSQSLAAAAAAAMRLGYTPLVLTSSLTGETRQVAAVHAAIARELVTSGHPLPPPVCLLSGGETTVTLRGSGRGGRNQEFALAAALGIAKLTDVVILSGGTDGTDGPTDAAGAIVDGSTLQRARQLGLDPERHLQHNDAYPFFAALGDLLITGPTNTNVMDLQLVLAGKPTLASPPP